MVLDKYHDTQYAEPALLRKAEALSNRKKYAEAKEAIVKFREKYPSSLLKSDAEQLNADIEAGLKSERANKQKVSEPMKDTSKQVPQLGN